MNAINKENSKVFLLILLGMLSAFGPFVTDMYLPSLPAMADYFSASLPMVQMGLTTSMIGLALGQIFFGPLSDKYGRRPLLLVSMLLFIVSTLFCLFAPDIYSFVTLRLIQGIAGAGGIVISRSVAIDKFSGKELAKMLAVIGAINGVAPVAAPVIGDRERRLAGNFYDSAVHRHFAGHRMYPLQGVVAGRETFEDRRMGNVPQFRHHRSQPPLYALCIPTGFRTGNPVCLYRFFSLYHSAALRVFSFCLQHLLCGKCSGYRSGRRPIGEISPHRERNADRMRWDAGIRSPSDGGTL
jgi:hypothetical protein